MHSLLARRGPLLGFVAGATVLLTASAAFACTTTLGTLTINGTNASGSATYQGNGTDENDPSGGYCTPPSRLKLPNAAATLNFTLTVSGTSCAGASLPAGTYDVRWIKSPTEEVIIDGSGPICHRGQVDTSSLNPVRPWISLGNITVNSSGATTKPFSLPAPLFRGPGNICLGESPKNINNEVAPVVFIDWTVI